MNAAIRPAPVHTGGTLQAAAGQVHGSRPNPNASATSRPAIVSMKPVESDRCRGRAAATGAVTPLLGVDHGWRRSRYAVGRCVLSLVEVSQSRPDLVGVRQVQVAEQRQRIVVALTRK